MIPYDEINRMSWDLASAALMVKERKVQPYSTGQIRVFLSAAAASSPELVIKKSISHYSPQPARDTRRIPGLFEDRTVRAMRDIHSSMGKKIETAFKGLSRSERVLLIRYLMWNLKIVEQVCAQHTVPVSDLLSHLSQAEGRSVPQTVMTNIMQLHEETMTRGGNKGTGSGVFKGWRK